MIALVLAAAIANVSPAAPHDMMVMGIGYHSCATWTETPDKFSEGEAWIYGYWTGLNQAGPRRDVGSATDSPGIIAEIRKLCEATPSASLMNMTYQVYTTLRLQGR